MNLVAEDIDAKNAEEWDQFLIQRGEVNPFQSAALLFALKTNPIYQPIGRLFRDSTTGIICSGYVLYVIQEMKGALSLLGRRVILNGEPFHNETDNNQFQFVLEDICKNPQMKGVFLDIWHDQNMKLFEKSYATLGFEYSPHLNYLIDLTQGKETLWKKITKRKRNYIKNNFDEIDIKIGTTIEDVEICYSLITETYRRVKLPLIDKSVFRDVFQSGNGIFLIALHAGKPIAARVALKFNTGLYDWYAGDSFNNRGLHANESLVWWILEYGASHGYTLFNFGGAGKPGIPYGPRDFKANFGGDLVEYGRHRLVLSPIIYQIYQTSIKIRKLITKG